MPTCQRCFENVDEFAWACPHCGWEPRTRGHLGIVGIIGFGLVLTGVGVVLGIPLIMLAGYLQHSRREDRPHGVSPT